MRKKDSFVRALTLTPDKFLMQDRIVAFLVQEFFVSAHFDDFAVVEHDDAVRVADGGEAMGNDKAGSLFEEFFQGVLNQAFGLGVHGTGGFVQDQNAWARDHRAGEFRVVIAVAKDPTAPRREIAEAFAQPNMRMRLTAFDEATGEFRAELIA